MFVLFRIIKRTADYILHNETKCCKIKRIMGAYAQEEKNGKEPVGW